jgi:hypothetical protein
LLLQKTWTRDLVYREHVSFRSNGWHAMHSYPHRHKIRVDSYIIIKLGSYIKSK